MPSPRGRFIVFEGGEGAGKSTQVRLLADSGVLVNPLVTREPGGTAEGAALRRLLLTGSGEGWCREAETLLMVADRAQHVARLIGPALEAGRDVLCDRFVFSTLAYQGAGRGVCEALIRTLHREACGDLWPDFTILLDIDPRAGLARSKRRLEAEASPEDRFEGLDLDFHDRVRDAFRQLAGAVPGVVLDATLPVETLAERIRLALA